jgi:hypothetical protein
MALSKVTSNGITDSAVTTAKIANCGVAEGDLAASAVTSAKITDGTVAAGDLASTLDLSSKTLTLPQSATSVVDQNIALLGFKMAVNEGLTVFNLVDGVVDEFHDESGTDEGEGSNDTYCSSNDNYINTSLTPAPFSAGFGHDAVGGPGDGSVTESDTSVAHSNEEGTYYDGNTGITPHSAAPNYQSAPTDQAFGTFTVPTGMTSVNIQVWGAGGGGSQDEGNGGGGGGYAEGTLAVTAGQVLYVNAGQGGKSGGPGGEPANGDRIAYFGGGEGGFSNGGGGGGWTGIASVTAENYDTAPETYIVAGSGGGGGDNARGGAGGGLVGIRSNENTASLCSSSSLAGGGSQTAGGQGGVIGPSPAPVADGAGFNPASGPYPGDILRGGFIYGGKAAGFSGGGGAGYYGGGGGGFISFTDGGGGGGSSYHGHPQITSGSTEAGADNPGSGEGGGVTQPNYVTNTNEGGIGPNDGDPSHVPGQNGFVLLTGTGSSPSTASTTIVSNAFTASSAPSTSRIVVFQETASGSPTLNTDIIASISRDGGSNFTTATLSDSGYVTGSSGQRILTGVATVSGQPSGTSMRWKLALANNQSKIHGVSLQWK